jgi:non-canonical poly(A) RNA polymerase PAPD5/7
MSRPSGLPSRPQNLSSQPPGRPYESDLYRPLASPPSLDHYSSYHDHQPYHRRDEMYQFRGNHANDIDRAAVDASYSSINRGGVQPAPKPGGDSYRPGRDGFSFRLEPPPSLDLNRTPDFYRDRSPHSNDRRRGYRNGNRPYQPRQRAQDRDSRARGGFSRKAAERPMLQTKRDPTPELMPGMEEEESAGVKYRAVEDMSDSDEADMDLSSNEEAEPIESTANEEPKKKQTRTDLKKSADGDSVPRWSNPDPYTVLPPVDEAQRKKKDVVKLIRKARIVSGSEDIPKPEATSDDFISFDFDDESGGDNNDDRSISNCESHPGVAGAPTGPRAYNLRGNSQEEKLPRLDSDPKSSKQLDTTTDPALGNRKRTIDDNIKAPAPKPLNRPSKKSPAAGHILEEWQVPTESVGTPWCTVDHSLTASMGHW